MSLDLETLNQIATDVGAGRHPGAGYSPEMKDAYARMKAELDEFREDVPDAFVHIAPGIEGIPGPAEKNDWSPDQERDEKGRFGSGSGPIDGGGGPKGAGEGKTTYENRVRRNMMVGGKVGSLATNPGEQKHGIPKPEYNRRIEAQGLALQAEENKKGYYEAKAANPSEYGSKDIYAPKNTLEGQQNLLAGYELRPNQNDKDPKASAQRQAIEIAENVAGKEPLTLAKKMVGTDMAKKIGIASVSASEHSVSSSDIDSEKEAHIGPERSILATEDRRIPQTPEAVRYASDGDEARAKMEDRIIVASKNNNPYMESANSSYKVTLDDGSKALFKPQGGEYSDEENGPLRESIDSGTYYKREAAFSAIANNLGVGDITPITVVHEHQDSNGKQVGSLQSWIDGTPSRDTSIILSKRGSEQMRVADYVTGNTDRHGGNLLITPDKGDGSEGGTPGLIDHGLSFPKDDSDRWIQPMESISRTVGPLEPATLEQIKNIDPVGLARTLMNNGIEPEAIRGAVSRAIHLQAHPEAIQREYPNSHMQRIAWARQVKGTEDKIHTSGQSYGELADKAIAKVDAEEDSQP